MTLRDYGHVVLRRRWLVLGAVLIASATSIVLSAMQTPVYSADALVLLQPRGNDALFESAQTSVGRRTIETEVQVINGEQTRLQAQTDLGLSAPPPEADVAPIGETDVIRITVLDENASNAATYANAYAEAYIEIRRNQSIQDLLAAADEVQLAISQLQVQIDAAEDRAVRDALVVQQANFSTTLDQLRVDAALRTGGATVIKTASTPTAPVEPTPARSAVLAAFVGLLIGLGAAFLIDYLDNKVRSVADLERLTDDPVLAQIPVDVPPDFRPVALSEPDHPSVEAFRGLRTNVQFLALDNPPLGVVLVTSSIPGEGKTTTAANLAIVLAHAGHRVALVDADLRRPRIHVIFDITSAPGLTELLLGTQPREVVRHVDIGRGQQISVYPCGAIPSSPSEMLSSKRMRSLLSEMGDHYDYVIVDSAPILPVSDSMSIAACADGVLVVAQTGHVTTEAVTQTLDRLHRISAPIIGLVLNQADDPSTGHAYTRADVSTGFVETPAPEPVLVADG